MARIDPWIMAARQASGTDLATYLALKTTDEGYAVLEQFVLRVTGETERARFLVDVAKRGDDEEERAIWDVFAVALNDLTPADFAALFVLLAGRWPSVNDPVLFPNEREIAVNWMESLNERTTSQ
jgi:hypothetical protein